MPIDFNIRPRHVEMFGKQGILKPLYERQTTEMALVEKEREEQSRFEQMKALTELRAKLERPFREAQIGRFGAAQDVSEYQLGQLQEEDVATESFAKAYAAEPTQQGKATLVRQRFAEKGMLKELMPTGGVSGQQSKSLVPILDKEGKFTGRFEWKEGYKSPPSGYLGTRGSQVSRLNLADRTLKRGQAKYNRDSKPSVRFDYSDIDWDSRPMKSFDIERAGFFGMGKGVVGGGRVSWMDNIMNTMATPATVIDSTGRVVPDETEYSRRANVIENFRAELADEPQSSSKEKMNQLLHDMERYFNESFELSSEEGQTYLSQPTQMLPQQRIVGEEVPDNPYGTWTGP